MNKIRLGLALLVTLVVSFLGGTGPANASVPTTTAFMNKYATAIHEQVRNRVASYAARRFFSPEGTPAGMRALPPGVGDSPLRTFEVLKPFPVQAGTVAPAFGEVGLGVQFFSPLQLGVLLSRGILGEVMP